MRPDWIRPPGRWSTHAWQIAALLGLSAVLGFAFNTANPLGVRWTTPPLTRTPAAPEPPPANRTAPNPPVPSATFPSVTPPPLTASSAVSLATAPPPPAPASPSTNQVSSADPAPPAFYSPLSLHWNEVQPLLEAGQILLVDARTKPAFDAGHIPGAILLTEPSPHEEILAFRQQYGTNTPVVVYCSSTSCSLSFRLAYKLVREYGFARVDYMTGGYLEYQRESALAAAPGLPERGPQPAGPSAPEPVVQASSLHATTAPVPTPEPAPLPISWARAADWVRRNQAILVDARPAAAYAAGHLPGAVSLPLEATPDQLDTFRREIGTHRTVVVYGERSGSLAALDHAARLLRELALPSARFLPEGYPELAALAQTSPAAPSP